MDLEAVALREFLNVICFPATAKKLEKFHHLDATSIEAIFNNFVEISQSPIAHVYLYDFWKFLD